MAVSLSWTVTVKNTSDTKATVKVVLKAKSNAGSWNGNARSGYITIAGTKYTFSHSFAANTTTTLATKSKTIERTTESKSISIKASYSTGVSSGTISKSGSTTVSARPKYTVKFETNGGTNEKSVSVFSGYNTTFPTTTKKGYSFLGWYTTNSTSGTKYAAGANTPSITSSRTYYAQWKINTYSISYDLNGGTASNNKTYNIETATFSLNNPTRAGYTFLGWTGTGLTSKDTSVSIPKGSTGNRSYTANWKINTYTVTLNANGGSVSSTSLTKVYNQTLTLPTPTRASYSFIEWNTQQDGNGTAYGSTYKKNEGDILYAIWEQSTVDITAHYYQNPNSASSTYTYKKAASKALKLTDPPDIKNYVFSGWYTSASRTGDAITIIAASSAVEDIYAKWTPTYILAYNINDKWPNDGIAPSGKIASVECESGKNVTLAYASTNFSYVDNEGEVKATASGWTTAANGTGDTYADGAPFSFTPTTAGQTKTLYAKWTAKKFNLTFKPGEGSGSPYSSSLDYQSTYNFVNPSNFNFTAPDNNYTFSYWEAEDGTIYKIGDPFIVDTHHTFIAQWEAKYKIANMSFSVQRTADADGDNISDIGSYIKITANGLNGYYVDNGKTIYPKGNKYKYKIKGVFSNEDDEDESSDYIIEETYEDTKIEISQEKIFNDNRKYTNCEIIFEDLSEYEETSIRIEDRTITFTFTIPLEQAIGIHIANDLRAISLFGELQDDDQGLVIHNDVNIEKVLNVEEGIATNQINMGDEEKSFTLTAFDLNTDTSNTGTSLQHNIEGNSSFYNAQRLDTNTSISFGVGSGGLNAGVYSHNIGQWLLYTNSEQTILGSSAVPTIIKSEGYIYPSVSLVFPNSRGIIGTDINGNEQTLAYLSKSNNFIYGSGSYSNNVGTAYYEGNNVSVRANNQLFLNGDSIRLYGHDSGIGAADSGSGTYNLSNSTSLTFVTNLTTLSAGSWIFTIDVRFPQINNTGTRGFELYLDDEAYGATYVAFAGANCVQAHSTTLTYRSTSSKIVKLYARQSSGGSMTISYYWRAMRIA